MTNRAISGGIGGRGAAFWLSVIATVSLVLLYIGDIAASIGGAFEGFATTWTDDFLGFDIAGVTIGTALTWVFWIASIALFIVLIGMRKEPGATDIDIEEPAFVRFLFHNSRAGLLWLPIRLFLGVTWLSAGLGKLTNPAWRDGSSLGGFWQSRVAEDGPITYDWYRSFLQLLIDADAQSWFAWVLMLGEIAVGLGLLVGALTGIAAFFGAFMNMSFLLAGSASTNPVLFTLAIGIILAWRVAGYYGLDRYLLPRLGTPWHPGSGRSQAPPPPGTG